ncbi:MAG: phytoene desaturase family protein, partial [Gemmataceae bacterium]
MQGAAVEGIFFVVILEVNDWASLLIFILHATRGDSVPRTDNMLTNFAPETPIARTKDGKPRSAIIIGAGPGGLAAALLLAKAGVEVQVIERLPCVGGRCSGIREQGFRFDLGPTFFLYPTVLERIFRIIGRDLHAEIPMKRLDPQYELIFGQGGNLVCTPDLDKMADEVRKFSPEDAANVRRFVDENRVKLERFRPALESPFRGWRDLFRLSLLKLLPILKPWQSLDTNLKEYFRDDRVRLAFEFQSKYLGMSPFNCPSLFSILSYLEYDYGVWHPIGGCHAVSEGMARVAGDMGVKFRLGESVQEVLTAHGRAVGIRSERGVEMADAVIMNADFAQAMQKLVPNTARSN